MVDPRTQLLHPAYKFGIPAILVMLVVLMAAGAYAEHRDITQQEKDLETCLPYRQKGIEKSIARCKTRFWFFVGCGMFFAVLAVFSVYVAIIVP